MFWKKYLGHIVFLLLLVHVLFYLFPVMLYQSLPTAVAQGTHYTPITITNNANQDITDYSVKIVLNATNWDGWNYTSSDGSDIYFLDQDNKPLYYWIEYFNKTEPNYNDSNYITVGIKPSSYGGSPLEVWVYADGTWYKGTNFRVEDNIPKADFSLLDIGGKTITRVALRHSSATWSDPTNVWIWDSEGNQLYHTTANSHTWDKSFPNYFEYVNVNYQAPEPEIIGYGKAIIWVKVNLTANSDTVIYMYYGGDNPHSSYNDPDKVFLFYDDFDDGIINSMWSSIDLGGATGSTIEEDGVLKIKGDGSDYWESTEEGRYVYIQYSEDNVCFETYLSWRGSTHEWQKIGLLLRKSLNKGSDNAYANVIFVETRDHKNALQWDSDGDGYADASYHDIGENYPVYLRICKMGTTIKAYYSKDGKTWVFHKEITQSGLAGTYYVGFLVTSHTSGTLIEAHFNYFKIYKYVDPEPSVSIGSSEVVDHDVIIEGVSPESVVGGTGDSVSFTVTLNNTLSQDVNVTVKLIDHRDVVRDEVNATVPANNTYNVSLTTVFTENDIGDHTWTISVYNASDNSLLDSCSVSVSVFNRTVEITAVNPESISGAPNDTITVNATIKSTLTTSKTVNVSLVDHNSVVRDYSEVSIDPDQSINISLTTTLTRDDHGDHVWKLVVRSGDTVYDVVNITVSVYINMSLEYSYTLSFNPEINASSISGIRYSYTINTYSSMNSGSVSGIRYSYNINLSACRIANLIEGSRQGYLFGISSCVAIYTNSTGNWTLEAEICNSTVYTIAFNFLYVFENGGEGYPDARINIYVNDTGTPELYTSIYIPQGNTTVMLPADHIYSITIPSSGSTTYGSSFELISYTVNGEEGVSSIVLDKDYVINIKYRIYKEATTTTTTTTTPPSSTPTSTQTPVITITVTPPPTMTISGNVSGWFSPSFSVGAPNLVSPQGLLMLALFIGLFIVYSRVFPWGQALAVSSAVCMIISIALFGLGMFSFFLVFFVVGLGAWKILGK